MSDHDAAPDPIDQAYVQAEAVLSEDEARAARRARVLAAVAREGATPAASPATRRLVWGRGRWLAAASVAGLGVLIATQIYTPPPHRAPTTPTAPASPIPTARGIAASPAPPAAVLSGVPSPRAVAGGPLVAAPVNPQTIPPPAPPSLSVAPAPEAFPAPPPPPPPSPLVVTAERRASDEASVAQNAPRAVEQQGPEYAASAAAAPMIRSDSTAAAPSDQAAGLRAAAATGRTAEVQALLARGVPVDAPDAAGNTALMNSIRADQPAAAAILRRHGASLDRRNDAGESARDMATAKGDAALDQALGLAP